MRTYNNRVMLFSPPTAAAGPAAPTAFPPFLMNEADFNAAKAASSSSAAAGKSVTMVLDFDDTIYDFFITRKKVAAARAAISSERPFIPTKDLFTLNNDLILHLADMLNAMDSIDHVRFMILSARPDDSADPRSHLRMPVQIGDVLPFFIGAVNDAIKVNHPGGISISPEDIHCLQGLDCRYRPTKKSVVLARKTDDPSVVLGYTLVPSTCTEAQALAALVLPVGTPGYAIHLQEINPADLANKKIMLGLELRAHPNATVIFFDDSPDQIQAARELTRQHPNFSCVQVIPPERAAPATPHPRLRRDERNNDLADCFNRREPFFQHATRWPTRQDDDNNDGFGRAYDGTLGF